MSIKNAMICRGKEFNLPESAKYVFLDALECISSDQQCLPTTEDILRVYEPTTDSISDYCLWRTKISGNWKPKFTAM